MKAIAIILGTIVAILGIMVGGCAIVVLSDFGAELLLPAVVSLAMAAGLLAVARAILRRAAREPVGLPHSDDCQDASDP